MEIVESTPAGTQRRTLSDAEVVTMAKIGSTEAKAEIARKELASAGTVQAQIDAIKKYLGLA